MTDVERLLRQIQAQASFALEALADEHEGNLRRAALLLELDAGRLAETVRTW